MPFGIGSKKRNESDGGAGDKDISSLSVSLSSLSLSSLSLSDVEDKKWKEYDMRTPEMLAKEQAKVEERKKNTGEEFLDTELKEAVSLSSSPSPSSSSPLSLSSYPDPYPEEPDDIPDRNPLFTSDNVESSLRTLLSLSSNDDHPFSSLPLSPHFRSSLLSRTDEDDKVKDLPFGLYPKRSFIVPLSQRIVRWYRKGEIKKPYVIEEFSDMIRHEEMKR